MSWSDIASLGARVRPLTDPKPPEGRRYSPFSASLTSTVEILATELNALSARDVIIELDLRERDIRLDGFPRADARPSHDGVAISFQSKFGPLRYATAEYTGRWGQQGWEANLRAIALSMKALRAVDRYGISKRGEQYQGWKALPVAGGLTSVAEAHEFVDGHGGLRPALKKFHPDNPETGDAEVFQRVLRAKELIEA